MLPPKGKTISLRLKAVETTWLSIKVDSQPEKQMTLRPEENASAEAVQRIYVVIGNAGGVELVHNEKALEKVGKSGEVVAVTFTPDRFEIKHFEKSKTE